MSERGGVPLRLLLVEDSELDAALLLRELRHAGFELEHRRVDSAGGVREALNGQHWDLVIADHNMPQFSSEEALALVHAADPDAPFIIVSGSIGEDVAVAAMKSGAHDYIMKDNLTRLVPAIERELRETQHRRAQRAAEETIRHLAFHDSLTGLINRNEFEQRLEGALRLAAGTEERHVLLYIDLDQFKVINDTCGHAAGDELLRRLAQVLQHKVRASDSLARLGGDEFGALLAGCRVEDGRHIADNLLNAVQAFRFHWEGKTFSIGASIGLVPMGSDTATATEVLRQADLACYAAKDLGRNRVLVYERNDSTLTRRQGEMTWVSRLSEAIERDELMFYFQPIAPLSDRAEGFHYELLLRLLQPDSELIGPSLFIPAAERYSLMPRLDRWVISRGLRRLAQLAQQGKLRPGTTFFMNLSGTSLSDDALPLFIREQLAELPVPPWAVGFELTETAAITHFDNALALIDAVRTLGCRVALDDFGTGMASFSYLKAMKVDYLKIDGSFVRAILEDPMDAAVVEAINHVAQVGAVQTIAECVESEPVLRKLQAMGVDYAQGFAVVRPEPWAQWPPASASIAAVIPS